MFLQSSPCVPSSAPNLIISVHMNANHIIFIFCHFYYFIFQYYALPSVETLVAINKRHGTRICTSIGMYGHTFVSIYAYIKYIFFKYMSASTYWVKLTFFSLLRTERLELQEMPKWSNFY